MTGEGIKTKQ